MKYASADLIHEHKAILFGLNILEQIAGRVREKNEADIKDIEGMVNFLKLFADKCHHGKEEGLLFPALEQIGVLKEEGPIGQMLAEHDEGRRLISEMTASVNNGILQADRFANAAFGYIDLLRSHIEKENQVLFPLGDRKLPAELQQQLLEQFDEFEEKVMGKGIHESLHKLLHDFEIKYLA